MLTLIVEPEIWLQVQDALERAGKREIGGIMMAEHVGPNEFQVCEITIHKIGGFASFIRRIEDALVKLRSFFERTRNQYRRFNYIGEWHSHPSFVPEPSVRDHQSMLEIATDPTVGANFVVLVIVKLDEEGRLVGTAHSYTPRRAIRRATLVLQGRPTSMGEGISIEV